MSPTPTPELGTIVQGWENHDDRQRGVDGIVGIYAGELSNGQEHRIRTATGTRYKVVRFVVPLNAPELRAAEEARRREAWLAERPARRAAFIEYETGRAIESGIRQAEMGLRFRYGFKCSRCSHLSRDPADTWDHAIQCRGAEPTRAALGISPVLPPPPMRANK